MNFVPFTAGFSEVHIIKHIDDVLKYYTPFNDTIKVDFASVTWGLNPGCRGGNSTHLPFGHHATFFVTFLWNWQLGEVFRTESWVRSSIGAFSQSKPEAGKADLLLLLLIEIKEQSLSLRAAIGEPNGPQWIKPQGLKQATRSTLNHMEEMVETDLDLVQGLLAAWCQALEGVVPPCSSAGESDTETERETENNQLG